MTALGQPSETVLDQSIVDDLGLAEIPPETKMSFLEKFTDELKNRLGLLLASTMSDDQLEEVGALIEEGDAEGAQAWLIATVPEYRKIVVNEFQSLKSEVEHHSASILFALKNNPEKESR